MSAELDRVKKLVTEDQIVAAVELPTSHRSKPLLAGELEDALTQFDDDGDYAHFVIRVKRTAQPLPKPNPSAEPEQQVSIDAMVNETLEMTASADYDPEFLLENAKILEDNGEPALARNIYQTMVRKGVKIPHGLAGMARTYEKEGDHSKAIRCYQEAIAYSSELSFFQSLAALQIRMGNDEEASQTILHALGLASLSDDQQFELHKSLGNCFTRLGEYEKAEHHYRKAYELNVRSDILQVNVGSLALQKGDFDSAQKHFQKALELNSTNDKAVSGMGMVHMSRGQFQRAYDSFLLSLKLNLTNLGAIYNLVKCAYELKKFDDAAQMLRNYIESNPVNTNILYSYAGILYHQGEYRAATAEVQKILETNPSHSGAKELGDLIASKLS